MHKSNFKRLISAVSAAAMLAGLAVPVMAEQDTLADEVAELADSSMVLETNDFENAEVGDILRISNAAQEPYTGFNIVDINMGVDSTGVDTETSASVQEGVGVDGTKALVFTSGKKATGTKGPRLSFKVPSNRDNFLVSMKVYPEGEQDMSYSDSVTTEPSNKLSLNKDEWNTVDIYCTRKGRVININGNVTVLADTSMAVPVMGTNITAYRGDSVVEGCKLYIDDITLSAITALPTPIPTPSPEPPKKLTAGDVVDFEDQTTGNILVFDKVAQDPVDRIPGFIFYISSRSGGGAAGTKWAITKTAGADGSNTNVLEMAGDQFANADRGPRAKLVEPEGLEDYKITFKAKRVDGANETQDICAGTSTTSNDGTAIGLVNGKWCDVTIYMYQKQRLILVDNKLSQISATGELPVIWCRNVERGGSVYIDDYAVSELTQQEALDAMALTIDIETEDKKCYPADDGTYSFIGGFKLPTAAIGHDIKWSAMQADENGNWVNAADIRVRNSNVEAVSPDENAKYKLVAEIADSGLVASKEFELSYIPTEKVVDTVLERLEIADASTIDNIEKKTDDEGNAVYYVRGIFTVPMSDWVVNYTWTPSEDGILSIDRDGEVRVYPKNADDIILTATASYGGVTKTKEFRLILDNYNLVQQDKVRQEFANNVLYAKGTDGEKLGSVTLEDGAIISFDVNLKTVTAADKNITISWTTSDKNILTTDGVINVNDKNAHDVTLTKTVTYRMDNQPIYSDKKDYKVKVQFNPDETDAKSIETANGYAEDKLAEAIAASETEMTQAQKDAAYKSAYNTAMEVLSDRYKTRFDAKYEANFDDIPASADDDFEVPVKGYFGSDISWTASDTCIKINDGTAKVTTPSYDRNVSLKATFTSGASTNANAATVKVEVEGKYGSSSGGSSGGGGGRGSSSSGGGNSYQGSLGVVTPVTPAPQQPSTDNNQTVKGEFTDLDQASWAAVAINELAKKGIVSGRNSVTFAPNDNITRAEFAKIITGAFNVPAGSASFTDVAADAWYASYIGACYAAGIITGYEDGTFAPDALVTRQDMAVMVMRAANANNVTLESVNEKIDFADADEIASYAADAVAALQQAGIINGITADTFAPAETATRAQAAKILYSFCK